VSLLINNKGLHLLPYLHLQAVDLKPKAVKKPTDGEVFPVVFNRILGLLKRYEEDGANNVSVDCRMRIDANFDSMTSEELEDYHLQLLAASDTIGFLYCLNTYERGHIYWYYKEHAKAKNETWETASGRCNLSRQQANKYIDYYVACSHYPRLLICEVNIEMFSRFKVMLFEKIHKDAELQSRLMAPLKDTNIGIQCVVKEGDFKPATSQSIILASKKNKMNAAWRDEDDIMDGFVPQPAKRPAINHRTVFNGASTSHSTVANGASTAMEVCGLQNDLEKLSV
jgi:hypothetical protein